MSKEAIDEFKIIYREEYGQELSDDEAKEKAKQLLMLFKGTYRQL